eukprot:3636393-Alexandrium_andersonii.AAC.1
MRPAEKRRVRACLPARVRARGLRLGRRLSGASAQLRGLFLLPGPRSTLRRSSARPRLSRQRS